MKKLVLTVALLMSFCFSVQAQEQNAMSDEWEKISIYDIKNPATLFGEDWAALAAGKEGDMNAMTIGWGQFGILWQKPVLTVYVAPERYTNEFMQKNDYFTVTSFPMHYKQALTYIGTHSGRDGDKLKEAGLNAEFTALGNPIFKEGNLAVECKIIYKEPFNPVLFSEDVTDFYTKRQISPHVQYVGEVVNVWRKKDVHE